MKKIYYYFLIVIFVLPLFLFYLYPLRGVKEKSLIESRKLEKVPTFTFSKFFKGEYQDELEKAISDQLLLSQTLRKNNKRFDNFTNHNLSKAFNIKDDECLKYIEYSKGYYTYGCSEYLIEKPNEELSFNYDKISKMFNSINRKKYVYFIEKDRSVNFNDMNGKEKVYKDIKKAFKADRYARFKLESFDEYKKYFYQTDHHWNYKGQYKGYTEIIRLLLGKKEKVYKPINTVTYDIIFYGSADRKNQTELSKEKFTVYEYPELKYKVYVDGKEKNYNNKQLYRDKKYNLKKYFNHYASYYGGDYAEVIYDFNKPDKDNILIISTSYSNSIKDLIASHFNKTYYVDIRHYENFDVNKYIEEHDIDKVLLMGDINSFVGGVD